jgi:hypothetical protein
VNGHGSRSKKHVNPGKFELVELLEALQPVHHVVKHLGQPPQYMHRLIKVGLSRHTKNAYKKGCVTPASMCGHHPFVMKITYVYVTFRRNLIVFSPVAGHQYVCLCLTSGRVGYPAFL